MKRALIVLAVAAWIAWAALTIRALLGLKDDANLRTGLFLAAVALPAVAGSMKDQPPGT